MSCLVPRVWPLVVCVWLLACASSKVFEMQFAMKRFKTSQGWLFLDKVVLSPGTSTISLATQKVEGTPLSTSGEIVLDIVLEEHWPQQEQQRCKGYIKSPLLLHELDLSGQNSVSSMEVAVEKEQYYYFVLKDCNSRFLNDYNNENMKIALRLEVLNNGSPMGEEEDHWLVVPVILVVGCWLVFSNKYFLRGEFQHDPDYAKMILFAGIATNMSSLIWRSFGYLLYLYTHANYTLFHLIYLLMHSISETMVIGLLVLVGLGWSINYLQGPNMDLAIPAFSFVAMVNVLSSLLTQLGNTPHDMHHTFDAVAGTILIITRLLTAVVFACCVAWTHSTSRYQVKRFIVWFGVLGFAYICSMPLIVLISNNWVEARQRNEFVFVCVESIKSVSNIALMYMVSSTKSTYSTLSYKNSSFLPQQPGVF